MALGENQVMVDGQVREIDHWIEHSDNYVQTWKTKYQEWNQPGKILAFRPGDRGHIRFLKLNGGTEENPIIIINKGQTTIRSTASYGLSLFDESSNVRVLGNGNPDIKYGIHVAQTNSGASGMDVAGKSERAEIAYCEISNTGFAGIMAKKDGEFGWTMHNIHFHHNYIHDTHGEGMYIGETKLGHDIKGVKVHHNLILRTGWDLWQIANSTQDVEIYNNTMLFGGLENRQYQNKGFQIGNWCTGNYYNNVIGGSSSNYMIIMGSYDIDIYNNLFTDTNVDPGMFIDDRSESVAGSVIKLRDNYMRGYKQEAILSYNNVNKLEITNNQYDPSSGNDTFIKYGSGAGDQNHTVTGNTSTSLPVPEYIDPDNDDYRIKPGTFYYGKNLGHDESNTPEPGNPPSAPYDANATTIGVDTIRLSWALNSEDEDGVKIYRTTEAKAAWELKAELGKGVTVYTDTPLLPNTTYFYKVSAYNENGDSDFSNIAQATTLSPSVPPATPSDLMVVAVSSDQINLSWKLNSDNETGVQIERAIGGDSGYTIISTAPSDTEKFADSGLISNTPYFYRVKAISEAGNSGYSNSASATTPDESLPSTDAYFTSLNLGAYLLFEGDVKGAEGMVPVESGDRVIDRLVITNVTFISKHTSLDDASKTGSIYKVKTPEKFVFIDPEESVIELHKI
jgi:hypothetical protein